MTLRLFVKCCLLIVSRRVGCSRCNTLHSSARRHGDSAVLPAHVGRLPAGDRAAQPGPHQRPPQARRGQDQEEEAAEEAEGEWRRPEMFSFLLNEERKEIDSWSKFWFDVFKMCVWEARMLFSAVQKVFFVKSLLWDFEKTALASFSSRFPKLHLITCEDEAFICLIYLLLINGIIAGRN